MSRNSSQVKNPFHNIWFPVPWESSDCGDLRTGTDLSPINSRKISDFGDIRNVENEWGWTLDGRKSSIKRRSIELGDGNVKSDVILFDINPI